jgi:hypothetical protein
MYCRLCKSEFRDGFSECSDCHIALVSSQAEAAGVATDLVWKRDNRERCNRVLDALTGAGIPFHSKELFKKQPWPWFSFLLFRFMTPRPTFELAVWVLHSDFARAQAVIHELEDKDLADEEERD